MIIKTLKTKKVISFLQDIQSSPILAISAELASRSKKWELAAKKWKDFIDKSGQRAPLRAYLNLFEAYTKLQKYFNALDTLNKANQHFPKNKKIQRLYKSTCATITCQIKNIIKSHSLESTNAKLEKLYKHLPKSPSTKTYITLTSIYLKLNLYTEAKKLALDGLSKFPDEVELIIQLVKIFQTEKDWPKAIFHLKSVLNVKNRHCETALQQLAYIYEQTGNLKDAENVLRSGVSRFPQNITFKIKLAKLLLKRSAEDEAFELYLSFEKLNPRRLSVQHFIDISQYFIIKENLHKAEEFLTKALDIFPGNLKIIELMAKVAFNRNNYMVAAQQFDLIGKVHVKKKKWKGAIRSFNHAAKLEQTNIHNPYNNNLAGKPEDISLISINEYHTNNPIRTQGLWKSYLKTRSWEKLLELALNSSKSHVPSPRLDKLLISALSQGMINNKFGNLKSDIYHPLKVDQLIYERLSERLACETIYKFESFYIWLGLYYVFFICGYLKTAYLAKEVAAKCGLNHIQTNSSNEIYSLMRLHSLAYLRSEETSEYSKYIISHSHSFTERIKAIKVLLSTPNLSKQDNKYYTNLLFQETSKYYPEDFIKLIYGKNIAIVGPADNGFPSGSEIDDFDIIIRPNTISVNHEIEYKKKFGSRTDITYFTRGSERKYRQVLQSNLNVLNLKYLVLKSVPGKGNLQLYRQNTPTRFITPQVTNQLYSPFAIPRIVSDIRPLKPKKIKIFGIDFYTGQNFYNPHYITKEESSRFERLLYGHAHHDLLYNFTEAKKWLQSAVMDFDDRLKQILHLTEDQYLNLISKSVSGRLEEIYSIAYNGPIFNRFIKIFQE